MSFKAPQPHPALSDPKTKLEKAAAKLEKKLAKLREKEQEQYPAWVAPDDADALAKIRARWDLPRVYLEFLERFSHLSVEYYSRKNRGIPSFDLYSALGLIQGQDGYSWNPVTMEPDEEWPKNFVVIGYLGGDPFCIDLSDGDDPALHYSEHGLGYWDFGVFRSSFTGFLEYLAKKGYVDLDDDEDDNKPVIQNWIVEIEAKIAEHAISLDVLGASGRAWKKKDGEHLIKSLMSHNIGVLSVAGCKLHSDRLERLQDNCSIKAERTETNMEFFLRSKNRSLDYISNYPCSDDSNTVFIILFTDPRSFQGGL